MIDWFERHLGANRVVLALSLARLGDGVGNSVLIVVLPLYVAQIPSRWPLPTSVLVGILISVFRLRHLLPDHGDGGQRHRAADPEGELEGVERGDDAGGLDSSGQSL